MSGGETLVFEEEGMEFPVAGVDAVFEGGDRKGPSGGGGGMREAGFVAASERRM